MSLVETWPDENGPRRGEVDPFERLRLSRSATHHVLPTCHETLVDNLQRDARHQPSEVAMIPEPHPTRRSAPVTSYSETDLACVVLAYARQNTQVSHFRGFSLPRTSRKKDVPVLMWTHSDRVKGCVRASKYSI